MNQGKLDVVKQEMAKWITTGISKLKWMGMGEFNLDDHYIYYYGQESLRRNGVALWVQSQKWQNDLSSLPRQTIQHHSNPSLFPLPLMPKKQKSNDSMKTYKNFQN